MTLAYCPMDDMVADIMIKPASKLKFKKFAGVMFGVLLYLCAWIYLYLYSFWHLNVILFKFCLFSIMPKLYSIHIIHKWECWCIYVWLSVFTHLEQEEVLLRLDIIPVRCSVTGISGWVRKENLSVCQLSPFYCRGKAGNTKLFLKRVTLLTLPNVKMRRGAVSSCQTHYSIESNCWATT